MAKKTRREELDEWIRAKGYTLTYRNGDWSYADYMKEVVDELTDSRVCVHCTIYFAKEQCELTGFPEHCGFFTVNSGHLSVEHKRFDDLFEARMIDMLHRLNRTQP